MTCWGTVDHPPPVAGCELLRKDGSIGAEERELEKTAGNNNTPEKVFFEFFTEVTLNRGFKRMQQ